MKEQIHSALEQLQFAQIGFSAMTKPRSLSFYENWLDEGLNADMEYLQTHLPQKRDAKSLLPNANSVISVTIDYFEHPEFKKLTNLKIASYAKGEDYHYFFKKKLETAALILKDIFPAHHFEAFTDSKPILERDFAHQSGLGWFGKNTMLIHQSHGSYFLIGEILTSLVINADKASEHPDRCGTCTKCIDACPTQALQPKKLDAKKCISYWTIESKKIPEISLAQNFGSWFFGCDICQDVCPWNIKIHSEQRILVKNETNRKDVILEIMEILKASNKSLERKFYGTPLSRARGFGLKRNALMVVLNIKAIELKEELEQLDLKNEKLNNFKVLILNSLGPDT